MFCWCTNVVHSSLNRCKFVGTFIEFVTIVGNYIFSNISNNSSEFIENTIKLYFLTIIKKVIMLFRVFTARLLSRIIFLENFFRIQ